MFLALGIQHAMRMRRIVLSPATCPALRYYSTLSLKRRSFGEKCYTEFPRRNGQNFGRVFLML